jgi:hypothetical protein
MTGGTGRTTEIAVITVPAAIIGHETTIEQGDMTGVITGPETARIAGLHTVAAIEAAAHVESIATKSG